MYDFMKWRSFNYPIKILQTLVSATNLKGTYFKTLFTNRYTYLAKLHFYTFIQKKEENRRFTNNLVLYFKSGSDMLQNSAVENHENRI